MRHDHHNHVSLWTSNPPAHLDLEKVHTQTSSKVSLISHTHILKQLSFVNIFVSPSYPILFLIDPWTWNMQISLKHHLCKSDHSENRKQTYSTSLRGKITPRIPQERAVTSSTGDTVQDYEVRSLTDGTDLFSCQMPACGLRGVIQLLSLNCHICTMVERVGLL